MRNKIKQVIKKIYSKNTNNEKINLIELDSESFKFNIIKLIEDKLNNLNSIDSAKLAMEIDNEIYHVGRRASLRYGNGVHTKHKHIKFHEFFRDNINSGENILDVGSSTGDLTSDIAKYAFPGKVVGIELEKDRVEIAQSNHKAENLTFIAGDATDTSVLPKTKVDIITLSNVLEHIDKRVDFLKKLIKVYKPKKFLIRVPTFERDWRVPLKKELGVDYRLDVTHFIEYTQDEFANEMEKAGLKIIDWDISWGEFRVVLEPKNK